LRTDDAETLPFPRFGPRLGGPDLSVVVPVFEEEAILPVLSGGWAGCSTAWASRPRSSSSTTARGTARPPPSPGPRGGSEVRRALALAQLGHQVAISAGLAESSGAAVVVMDGDLQTPPEAIPALLARHREGYDVVHAVRASRPEAWPKRLAYAAFYRVLGRAATLPIPIDSGDSGSCRGGSST
jgi:dolichol-phosphate mannosyltransferase